MRISEHERRVFDLFATEQSVVSCEAVEKAVGWQTWLILVELPHGQGFRLSPVYRLIWRDYQRMKGIVATAAPPELSEAAEAALSFSKSRGPHFDVKDQGVAQELLDATLIERTTLFGKPAFKRTEAGETWGKQS